MILDTTKLINNDLIETNNMYDKIIDVYGFDVTLMRTTCFDMFVSLMYKKYETIEFNSIFSFMKSYHENTETGKDFETLIKNYLIKSDCLNAIEKTADDFIRSSVDKELDNGKYSIFNHFERFFDIDLVNACKKNPRYKYDIAQCLFRLYLLNKDDLSQDTKAEVVDYYRSFYSVLFASIKDICSTNSSSLHKVDIEVNSLYGSIEQTTSLNGITNITNQIPVLKSNKPNVFQINLENLYEAVLNDIENEHNCKIKLRSFWNDELINKLSFNVDTKNKYCKTMNIDFKQHAMNNLMTLTKKGDIIHIWQRSHGNESVFYPITFEEADDDKRMNLNFYVQNKMRLDSKPHIKYGSMDIIDIVFGPSVNGTKIEKIYYPVRIEFLIEGYYDGEEALEKNKYAPFISQCYRRASLPDFYLGKIVVNCYVEIENLEWDKDGKIDWIEKHIDNDISADGRYTGIAKDEYVEKSGPIIKMDGSNSKPIVQMERIENDHEKVEVSFYDFYKYYKDKFNTLNIKSEQVHKIEIDKNQSPHIPTELVIHVGFANGLGKDEGLERIKYTVTIADKSVKTLWDNLFITDKAK